MYYFSQSLPISLLTLLYISFLLLLSLRYLHIFLSLYFLQLPSHDPPSLPSAWDSPWGLGNACPPATGDFYVRCFSETAHGSTVENRGAVLGYYGVYTANLFMDKTSFTDSINTLSSMPLLCK